MEAAQLFLYCMLDVEAVFNAYACFEEHTSGQQHFAHPCLVALNLHNALRAECSDGAIAGMHLLLCHL